MLSPSRAGRRRGVPRASVHSCHAAQTLVLRRHCRHHLRRNPSASPAAWGGWGGGKRGYPAVTVLGGFPSQPLFLIHVAGAYGGHAGHGLPSFPASARRRRLPALAAAGSCVGRRGAAAWYSAPCVFGWVAEVGGPWGREILHRSGRNACFPGRSPISRKSMLISGGFSPSILPYGAIRCRWGNHRKRGAGTHSQSLKSKSR